MAPPRLSPAAAACRDAQIQVTAAERALRAALAANLAAGDRLFECRMALECERAALTAQEDC